MSSKSLKAYYNRLGYMRNENLHYNNAMRGIGQMTSVFTEQTNQMGQAMNRHDVPWSARVKTQQQTAQNLNNQIYNYMQDASSQDAIRKDSLDKEMAGVQFQINEAQRQEELAKQQQKRGLWQSGLSAVGGIAGAIIGGPAGAMVGSGLGGALGSVMGGKSAGKVDYQGIMENGALMAQGIASTIQTRSQQNSATAFGEQLDIINQSGGTPEEKLFKLQTEFLKFQTQGRNYGQSKKTTRWAWNRNKSVVPNVPNIDTSIIFDMNNTAPTAIGGWLKKDAGWA